MIPFVDLKNQFQIYRPEFEAAMGGVLESAGFILGPAVSRFEKNYAGFLGTAEAVGVANGTDALRLALEAIGVGPGDEVLVPANTFIATAIAVHQVGARPVPVDIDEYSFLIDLPDAEKRLTSQTRAIIPVHLYGQAADMDALMDFADSHKITVIEDACQSHGACWQGRRTGSFGAAGCFSFYPGKNLGAFGDAGLVATNDPDLAERLHLLRNYGSKKKYYHELPGGNSRLDSIQAAVLDVKLKYLQDWNRNRFAAAVRYSDGLAGVPNVKAPAFDRDDPERHVFHLYVINCDRRDDLAAFLNERQIQSGVHYPVPIHLHEAFRHLGYGPGDFPVAEGLAGRILSLPMFPEITADQTTAVVDAIKEFFA